MVVTNGIERAIQYYHAISNYLNERKSRCEAIVAFSGEREYKFGWNIGGGIRIVRGAFVIRGELRDHVTKFESDAFGLGLEEIIAVSDTFTIHNIEISVGLGVRF